MSPMHDRSNSSLVDSSVHQESMRDGSQKAEDVVYSPRRQPNDANVIVEDMVRPADFTIQSSDMTSSEDID